MRKKRHKPCVNAAVSKRQVKYKRTQYGMKLSDDKIRGFILTPLELPRYPSTLRQLNVE